MDDFSDVAIIDYTLAKPFLINLESLSPLSVAGYARVFRAQNPMASQACLNFLRKEHEPVYAEEVSAFAIFPF